jgi:ATP-dependent DNA helicase RecG
MEKTMNSRISQLPLKESETVEFKTKFNKETIETLVAFSNTKGGTVYIGVSDAGKVIGTDIGKESVQNYINEIKTKTFPHIFPESEIMNCEGKTVLALYVHESLIKPISVQGVYYKRINCSNHVLNTDEISNEHIKNINSSWDLYPDSFHTKDDLSEEKIKKYLAKIRD